ncbi:integrase [Duganella sp. BJB488]|uniref:gamma-mobile-trio integrase GmtZ n=2 Tax=Duganella TaxID=75654 RepID=UPI000E34F2B8|nr:MULTISPECIES: integrase family protein [unclassified Duganella]RFP10452.1 integrase [Duganella sp. BJB489]RFP14288.1 integrase [Duganella sp. BJB488]RFP30225.1 integrase [Duganella sp. BJB480]
MPRTRRSQRIPVSADVTFEWMARELGGEFEEWRVWAATWLATQPLGLADRINGLRAFFKHYLHRLKLPVSPSILLRREQPLPDFFETSLPQTHGGIKWNNKVRIFLDWVLQTHFSEPDDNGRPVVSPVFWNPVSYRSQTGKIRPNESVHSPLPYRYIVELRERLAPGKNFRDWLWTHSVAHGQHGVRNDWFEVTEDKLDYEDPDCVWRTRRTSYKRGNRQIYELWSPVRAVVLITKLMIPLRTHQVRVLDSGEADTWRYASSGWELNKGAHAGGTKRKPVERGVFRQQRDLDLDEVRTSLYINTNKTADIAKQGETGYVIPWQYTELLYWLEKLRNWQAKYNPVPQPISWHHLDHRHLRGPRSDYQLSRMPDTCFLFRDAAAHGDDKYKPIIDDPIFSLWYRLLLDLEQRCAARGETGANGKALKFVADNTRRTTLYPLHSLRVSLLTCLAVDAEVPLVVLAKLVAGHSRVIMTLYYTKIGVTQMTRILDAASSKLQETAEAGLRRFLAEAEYDELTNKIVANNMEGLKASLVIRPEDRNPAGWMARSYGMCLVGGNSSSDEFNGKVGGCANGGELLRSNTKDVSNNIYAPVPGGPGNCIRCRWFVTEPHYIDALRAHFNNLSYHLVEQAKVAKKHEVKLEALKAKRYQAEQADAPFTENAELARAATLWEMEIAKTDELGHDLIATFRLIKRCFNLIEKSSNGEKFTQQIVAVGGMADLKLVFESTQSELLQISGICQDAELYPDENPGQAVFRRSQLLDSALYREGYQPVFAHLSRDEQLHLGNRFMDHLAILAQPDNQAQGLRRVVGMIETGRSLADLGLEEDWERHLEPGSDHGSARVYDLTNKSKALPLNKQSP